MIWKPRACSDGNEPASRVSDSTNDPPQGDLNGKGKGKEARDSIVTPESSEQRVVWLRVHPSAFDVVSSSLQLAASSALDAAGCSSDGKVDELEVEIADLRGQINAFEVTGPKSNQVLRGALSPVPEDRRVEFQKVCYLLNHPSFSSDPRVA